MSLGKAWYGKGKQPHGQRRGGEPANMWRDQARALQEMWHPLMAPCLGLFFWCWQRFRAG